MTRRLSTRALVPLALLALAVACTEPDPPPPPGPPRPVLSSEEPSSAVAVNAAGVAVGWTIDPDTENRIAWRKAGDGPVELLDPTGTGESYPTAINRRGVIVGVRNGHGTVWYPGGRTVELPVPAEVAGSVPESPLFLPRDINDYGLVGGVVPSGSGLEYPVVWDSATGRSRLLPPLLCLTCFTVPQPGSVTAVNNFGQIVGASVVDTGPVTVLWNPDGEEWEMTDRWGFPWTLPHLPNLPGTPFGVVRDINDAGTIVGSVLRPKPDGSGLARVPALWQGPDHLLTVIPTPGGEEGEALAINAGGTVVGVLTGDASPTPTAFRWTPGEPVAIELPGLGGASMAAAISDTGVIVGQAGTGADLYDARERCAGTRPVPWPRLAETTGGDSSVATTDEVVWGEIQGRTITFPMVVPGGQHRHAAVHRAGRRGRRPDPRRRLLGRRVRSGLDPADRGGVRLHRQPVGRLPRDQPRVPGPADRDRRDRLVRLPHARRPGVHLRGR